MSSALDLLSWRCQEISIQQLDTQIRSSVKNYILGVVEICMVTEAVEMAKITKEGYNESKENIFVSTNLPSHHYTSV